MTAVRSWAQPSPVGTLSVTVGPAGVRSVAFAGDMAAGGRPDRVVARRLDAYFAGDLDAVRDLAVDLDGLRPFACNVLEALRRVDPGTVVSYGQLARLAGHPGAARAVGQVMATNPLVIVVPCHRVLAGGTPMRIGGYGSGLHLKRWLLAHEGVSVD